MALLCHNLAMLLCLWAGKQSLYPFHILEFPRSGDTQNTNALCLLDLPVTAQWGPGCGHRVSPNGQSHTGYPAGPSLGLCSADLFYPRKLLLCVGMRPQCCLQFSRAACYPGLNPPLNIPGTCYLTGLSTLRPGSRATYLVRQGSCLEVSGRQPSVVVPQTEQTALCSV